MLKRPNGIFGGLSPAAPLIKRFRRKFIFDIWSKKQRKKKMKIIYNEQILLKFGVKRIKLV